MEDLKKKKKKLLNLELEEKTEIKPFLPCQMCVEGGEDDVD